MLDRRGRFGHGAEHQSETPDTSVDLGVAIRAKHDAAFKLLSDLLPWSIDAVDGDREFLLGRVGVVELHRGRREPMATRPAPAAKRCDRSKLHLAAQLHYPMLRYNSRTRVPDSVTVRANEVALGGFLHQTGQTSAELAEAKLLCRWIPMMELQSFRPSGVAAIDAASAARGDEIKLSFPAPLS